jgi:hypothetical protein
MNRLSAILALALTFALVSGAALAGPMSISPGGGLS